MAIFVRRANVTLQVDMLLSEQECEALVAMASYGTQEFLKAFYESLGRSYLEQHAKGVEMLFATARDALPKMLDKAKKARALFHDEDPEPDHDQAR